MRIEKVYWRGWNPQWWLVFGFTPIDTLSRGRYRMFRVGPLGFILEFRSLPHV